MSEMSLGSLFYELAFKADTTKFSDFIGMVGKLNMSSILGSGALGQLYKSAEELLEKVAPIAMEMQTFANVTGLSARQMKAWDNSAQQLGVASGATTSAVKGLQASLASLWSTSPDSNFLQAVGFLNNVGAGITNEDFDPDKIWTLFDKIGNAITKMEPAQARMVLGFLHMDESLMNAFRNMEKFTAEREASSVADEGSLKTLTEYWQKITKAGQEWLVILVDIGAGLAAIITPVLAISGGIIKAIHDSKALQAVLIGVAIALAAAFGLRVIRDSWEPTEEVPDMNTLVLTNADVSSLNSKYQIMSFKEARVLIGNIDSMGVGLTLTASRRVIFVEYSCVPGLNEQAEDRVHRITQTEGVYCQYLVMRGGMDELMLNKVLEKQKDTEAIHGDRLTTKRKKEKHDERKHSNIHNP